MSNYFGVSGMEDDDGVGDFRMMMKEWLFLVDVRLSGEIGYCDGHRRVLVDQS